MARVARRMLVALALVAAPPARGQDPKSTLAADESAVAAHVTALRSADGPTRAAAAAALRVVVARYPSGTVYLSTRDGGEAAWKAKLRLVDLGMPREELLRLLPPALGTSADGGLFDGDSHVTTWRLDYHWTVRVHFRNSGEVIARPELFRDTFAVYVAPPAGFTGTWTTWHVNGQKAREVQYRDGKYVGTHTTFHDNGAKHTEQEYANHEAHGAGAGWYADGRPSYAARYANGKQDGTWTHWYANGVRHSEEHFVNGRHHGRNTRWHENGQRGAVNDYRQGVRHGIEAAWDENGTPHYKRRHADGVLVEVFPVGQPIE